MERCNMHFLGCGNSHSYELGNSCAVFSSGECELVIDFGFTAFHAFKSSYRKSPSAIWNVSVIALNPVFDISIIKLPAVNPEILKLPS